jgi:hypothetical protein
LLYRLGMDHTENNASNSSSIVAYMSAATIMWWLLSHWLTTGVFTEPSSSNGCLCWLHNSRFQQTCHNIFQTLSNTSVVNSNNYSMNWATRLILASESTKTNFL